TLRPPPWSTLFPYTTLFRSDGGKVGEDVGVVVFQIVQNRRARTVMHELRPLVEEGGVVLVRLDDKRPYRGVVPGRYLQVVRHAAAQEVGAQARGLEYPGQDRTGGG